MRRTTWMVQVWLILAIAICAGCDNSLPRDRPRAIAPVDDPAPANTDAPIEVKPNAALQLAQLIREQQGPCYLRLRVVPGGCTGVLHKLDLESQISSEDYVFESSGIKVVVFKRQVEMLRGTQVDFGESHGRQGFMIKIPNLEGESLKKWLPVVNADAPPAPKLSVAERGERITQFRKLALDDPENELAHYRLGQLLLEDGQYSEALRSFERTLQLSPDFSKVYQLQGECLIRLDQKERAITVLNTGWQVASKQKDDPVRDAIADLLSEIGAPVSLQAPTGKAGK